MRLRLINGYPYPFPEGLPPDEEEAISIDAAGVDLVIDGVVHFEWLHTVTVEFNNVLSLVEAQRKTGWPLWGRTAPVLEAPTSSGDGYGHPAIIARDKAYCGFILEDV